MHKLLHFLRGILIAVHIVSAPVQVPVPQIASQTATATVVATSVSPVLQSNSDKVNSLQKKIDDLTAENKTLTQNAPTSPVQSATIVQPAIQYSDFTLGYTVTTDSQCGNNINYNFYSNTNRNIVIKKMVVQVPGNSYVDSVLYEYGGKNMPSGNNFMSESSEGVWIAGNKITIPKTYAPFVGANLIPFTITFNDTGKNCGTSNVIPLFDQWVVWDMTTNKQVKIVQ